MREFGTEKDREVQFGAPACSHCQFWDTNCGVGTDVGICRRTAPMQGNWPATGKLEWCGDFQPTGRTRLQRAIAMMKLGLGISAFVAILAASLANLFV